MTWSLEKWIGWLAAALAGCALIGASAANAVSVRFVDSVWAEGFVSTDPGFPTQPGYELPASSAGVLAAASDGSAAVPYTLSQCILLAPGGLCQNTVPLGSSFTSIATLSFAPDLLPQPLPADGMLFFLSGLSSAFGYAADSVSVVLDPAPMPGFDFTPLETVVWTPPAAGGQSFYYLGFRVLPTQLSATLRVDVASLLAGGTPSLTTNATYDFTIVPEPATALLLGLGTLGLALARRR